MHQSEVHLKQAKEELELQLEKVNKNNVSRVDSSHRSCRMRSASGLML